VEANYYDLLGIPRDSTPDEIRVAYRKQSMRWHPDRNQGNKDAEERFKQLAAAYALLKEPSSRAAYDLALDKGQAQGAFYQQRVDPETAAALFVQEMIKLAYELTMQNVKWSRIAQTLKERGCPNDIADRIAVTVETERKAAVRSAALKSVLIALAAVVFGVIVSAISYSAAAPGGMYFVSVGLFLYSGYNFLRAMYFLISGRAPGSGKSNENISRVQEAKAQLNERWECPKCRHSNPNLRFTCEQCGYRVV